MKKSAVILLSGGLDSTTAMWKVKDRYSRLFSLTFTYGSGEDRVLVEITKRLAERVKAHHRIIDLPWLREFSEILGSSLVTGKKLPEPDAAELEDPSLAVKTAGRVWVPSRNLVFLAVAASYGETIGGDVDIIAGFDREEAETFPDNSWEFIEGANRVLKLATLKGNIRLEAPLVNMKKSDIAQVALSLGVPVEYTSSCYRPSGLDAKGRPIHCGKCESCVRRKRGFRNYGEDKTVYAK